MWSYFLVVIIFRFVLVWSCSIYLSFNYGLYNNVKIYEYEGDQFFFVKLFNFKFSLFLFFIIGIFLSVNLYFVIICCFFVQQFLLENVMFVQCG